MQAMQIKKRVYSYTVQTIRTDILYYTENLDKNLPYMDNFCNKILSLPIGLFPNSCDDFYCVSFLNRPYLRCWLLRFLVIAVKRDCLVSILPAWNLMKWPTWPILALWCMVMKRALWGADKYIEWETHVDCDKNEVYIVL